MKRLFTSLMLAAALILTPALSFADERCPNGAPSIAEQEAGVLKNGMAFYSYTAEDSAKIVPVLKSVFGALADMDFDQIALASSEENRELVVVGLFKAGCTVAVASLLTDKWKAISTKALESAL